MNIGAEILLDGSLKITAGQYGATVAPATNAEATMAAIDQIIDMHTGGLRHKLVMAVARAVDGG